MRYENGDRRPVNAITLARPNLAERDLIDRITWLWCGREAICTSANDREHMEGSKHYTGEAIDLRILDIYEPDRALYAEALRSAFWGLFEVIQEPNHIHMEYDPRSFELSDPEPI